MVKNKLVSWMKSHKLLPDREGVRISDEIFQRAEVSENWDEWDAHMEEIQSAPDARVSWWVDAPFKYGQWWKPVSLGSDEYNRKVVLFGFNWTGQVAVAIDRPTLYVTEEGTACLNLPTKRWTTTIHEIELADGIKALYNDHHELFCVEIGADTNTA
jgi:hypothetical protein